MKRKVIKVMIGLFVAGMFCLTGCGGGGSTETTQTPTPTGTTVNLTTFKGFLTGTAAAGSQMSFTLTGSDTSGNAYSGSFALASDGTTTFEGQSTTKSRVIITLTKTSTGASATGTFTEYFLATNGNLYKQIDSSGVTGVPSVQTPIADNVHVGDLGNLWNVTNSDGTSESCTWKLDADFNNNSKLILSFVTKNSFNVLTELEEDTFYLNSNGTPYKYAVTFTSNGQTLSMSGNRN